MGTLRDSYLEERCQQMLCLVTEAGRVSVAQLSEEFGASEVTIRNDLQALANRKLIVRTHGGAVLASLILWTRGHLFLTAYAHTTVPLLLAFFRLPGRVLSFHNRVLVTLRPLNDRKLNHDLVEFYNRVNQARLHLPSGKSLLFRIADPSLPISDMYP